MQINAAQLRPQISVLPPSPPQLKFLSSAFLVVRLFSAPGERREHRGAEALGGGGPHQSGRGGGAPPSGGPGDGRAVPAVRTPPGRQPRQRSAGSLAH